MIVNLYPLKFNPIYMEKVWGGRSLEKRGRQLPTGQKIGESWELVDLASTSQSGGGGNEERSTIANGPLAGQTLNQLITLCGPSLMGRLSTTPEGGFPLLIKYLDAHENLSVQVHPSEQYAAEHDDAFVKTECWYIIEAKPGAVIYKGIKQGVTSKQFRNAIVNNTVMDLMIAIPVRAGEMHYLPSGTCHAIGEGLLIAEIQLPSDTTYRVYDWGRTGRELHIEQAMACIDFGPCDSSMYQPNTTIENSSATITTLVHCDYFQIDRLQIKAGFSEAYPINDVRIWMILDGAGLFCCEHDQVGQTPLSVGETLLLPPGMIEPCVSIDKDTTLLEISFPQAVGDIIA